MHTWTLVEPSAIQSVQLFESGDGVRTDTALAQYALDFSNRIYQVMGIRPAIYINGNYASILQNATA